MRFTSNGYPHERIFAYEYDTNGSTNDVAIAELDGFIAEVKAKTGAAQVDVLAHSRGTTVMHEYLGNPDRAATVRRYVNFDGRTAAAPPGGVPTLAIWGEGDQTREIGGAENVYFPNKAHTEVTTSREAFAEVYEFLTGRPPETKNVRAREARQGHGRRAGERCFPPTAATRGRCSRSTSSRARPARASPGGPLHSMDARRRRAVRPAQGRRPQALRVRASQSSAGARSTTTPSRSSATTTSTACSTRRRSGRSSRPARTTPRSRCLRMREWWGDQSRPRFERPPARQRRRT